MKLVFDCHAKTIGERPTEGLIEITGKLRVGKYLCN
jgi:hypothetical protein